MNEEAAVRVALRPNFTRANKIADEALRNTGYPKAPIPLIHLVESNGWKVQHEELHGADGYTAKVERRNSFKYVIYIATDMDSQKYSQAIIQFRQRFTLAHEIGHILLHSHIDWHNVSEELDEILEVEANWFASRLLMPDYIFIHISDMDPNQLSEKCQVNYSAAQKRIGYLNTKISNHLIREASKWVNLEDVPPEPIKQTAMSDEEYTELEDFISGLVFKEVAITYEDDEINCFVCGHTYLTTLIDTVPLRCVHCGADNLDLG
ncbi:hypothetical protein BK133_05295 [Paenibacillus sp. FSL H8-0548]|uniref:ImmA/IrrE family metallo-endopeptidase n=1 Tax=Paenibacillus sp. FSL H8-0548 TaxID=1920422 RepID=UPI00096D5F4A|nr:ImmA/IrrE family metallo-endopeptidase [Paenibacillus sp. FSL H8-0548]OMF37473.1 hypothetical protein BK133_05295 [Paenibacillus sp. FSL H8-0548]